jgi:hypothetical protein
MKCKLLWVPLLTLGISAATLPAQGQPQAPTQQTSPQPSDDEARRQGEARLRNAETAKLEVERDKLLAETEKLKVEKEKMETDVRAWIAPAISALSVLFIAIGLIVQYFQATRLQRTQARVDGELKMMEILMASRSPAMAQDRANLFLRMYRQEMSRPFAETIADIRKRFPGDIGMEVREKFFEVVGAHYQNPHDIQELARRIFTGDEWLQKDLTPPKTP